MIEELKREFEQNYFKELSSVKGLEKLAEEIKISKNTLRRFLGKMKNENTLSSSSLNLISNSLNYASFNEFENSKNHKLNSQFDDGTLLFYQFLKDRKINEKEVVFWNINLINSKKILQSDEILMGFVQKFKNYPKILEYVLGWHPDYGRISQKKYQEILILAASKTKESHFRVFAYSFAVQGIFLSTRDISLMEKYVKNAEVFYYKMLKVKDEFYIFPILRFSIAQIFLEFSRPSKGFEDLADEIISLPKKQGFDELHTIVFNLHLADAFNILGKYDKAFSLLANYSDQDFNEIWTKYHTEKYFYFFKITKIMSMLGQGNIGDATSSFAAFNYNRNDTNITFDIQPYLDLQYFTLGYFLDKKNKDIYREKVNFLMNQIGFTKWEEILNRL